jgi:hypothetical protein
MEIVSEVVLSVGSVDDGRAGHPFEESEAAGGARSGARSARKRLVTTPQAGAGA